MTNILCERVDVPEFGAGMYVNVRNMTAYDRELVAVWGSQGRGFDGTAIIVGLCSYDDKGALVFGESKAEAIGRAAAWILDPSYWPAFRRIATKAFQLTARVEPGARVPKLGEEE